MIPSLRAWCKWKREWNLRSWVIFLVTVTFVIWFVVDPTHRLQVLRILGHNTQLKCNVDLTNYSSLLGPTREDDLMKIASYRFPDIHTYVNDLFPPETMTTRRQEYPVFVSGFSSNHFEEGLEMVRNVQEKILVNYTKIRLIIFDLGLKRKEISKLLKLCKCEVRRFPYEKFPFHVRWLNNYTFKPIIIQTIAKEHPFLFWMDASLRFKTSNIDQLLANVTKLGLMADDMGSSYIGTIAEHTLQTTFNYLNEDPCAYATQGEKQGGFLLIYATPFITQYFLKPLVSCALSFGCMEPNRYSLLFLGCPPNDEPFKVQLCHRYDQSLVGILFTRLFHRDMKSHAISTNYFFFDK